LGEIVLEVIDHVVHELPELALTDPKDRSSISPRVYEILAEAMGGDISSAELAER
jgi:phage/plasmid-associated DNA primase